MLAEVDAEALVLPANEDGTDDIAYDENSEEDVVQAVVVDAVEDGKEDEACAASDGGHDADAAIDFLPDGCVGREFTGMPQPSLKDEGNVKTDDGYGGHGDEEGLEALRADICGGVKCHVTGMFDYLAVASIPEMYAIVWPSLMDEYLGDPWTLHVISMARSIASHTSDENIGTAQYERNHMLPPDPYSGARSSSVGGGTAGLGW